PPRTPAVFLSNVATSGTDSVVPAPPDMERPPPEPPGALLLNSVAFANRSIVTPVDRMPPPFSDPGAVPPWMWTPSNTTPGEVATPTGMSKIRSLNPDPAL